jgi:NADPH:quinone reductase
MASGSFAAVPAGRRPDVRRLIFGLITPEQSGQLTRRALDLAAQGVLRPVIAQRFGLGQAAEAHAAIESRATIGKTLLVADTEVPDVESAGGKR